MACFVLVHGAFEGGWCWSRVAPLLRAAGHAVFSPTLTGCGERFHSLTRETTLSTHAGELERLLFHQDLRGVVLVGADRAWVDARRHPHPLRSLYEPLQLEHAPPPRTYVVHTRREGLVKLFGVDPLAPFAARARAEGWRTAAIDAPHDAMITHPRGVVEALFADAR